MKKTCFTFLACFLGLTLSSCATHPSVPRRISSLPPAGCSRLSARSLVEPPESIFSQNGILRVSLSYRSSPDPSGNPMFCYVLPDGSQSPTLHLKPGDRLILTLKNETAAPSEADAMQMQVPTGDVCGASTMTSSSTNIHYHGANISPSCHQDDVLHTLVNSGESFTYDIQFPKDEPPGVYWYHPHVHGQSEAAVLGGASGAMVIDGIENEQPEVAGLAEQILIVRDNLVPGNPTPGGVIPSWDLSVNNIPVPYPSYPPAIIAMKNGEQQFWRVLNAGADSILDLKLLYDGAIQPLRIVALDGVATGSQDGEGVGTSIQRTHVLLGPGARAEFIVVGPASSVKNAVLMTEKVNTGPDGDSDPARVIAAIDPTRSANLNLLPAGSAKPLAAKRFHGLASEKVSASREIYFSEVLQNPKDPNSPTNFYVTENGSQPALFHMGNAPAITVTQGSTEDWVVSNQTQETHVFHIHQIHFLLLEKNGIPVSAGDQQFLDTVQIPFWSGKGPYPSVKIRMDFRGSEVGDVVYHCHILEHEDGGMMATLRIVPRK